MQLFIQSPENFFAEPPSKVAAAACLFTFKKTGIRDVPVPGYHGVELLPLVEAMDNAMREAPVKYPELFVKFSGGKFYRVTELTTRDLT